MSTKPGIYLIVLPDYSQEGYIHWISMALKNHLPAAVDYTFILSMKGEEVFECYGTLEPTDIIDLEDMPFAELNENPVMRVRYTYTSDEGHTHQDDKTFKLKPKQLHQGVRYSDLVQEQALVFEVFTEKPHHDKTPEKPAYQPFQIDPEQLKQAMLSGGDTPNKVVHVTEARDEVDLHLEALIEDASGMSDSQKLQLQLDTFEQVLENAIANNLHYLVVIHGIGKGKLKREIHHRLDKHPVVTKYRVANDRRYGEGATEIFI